ncbi:phosphoenolpyruvate--protein phosphotransferase [Candidatus Xianfuyuplasma coldseepsis]|uniref:Phosphoenolpyruvate-protein phosphotransferase n=2 Tax=Candidatus Xianfuyuplasma coldseepsis TaxID=2782163 RepID=A0A7L7KST1_9MOLU|nr:phosphoenolpyruvate--protein phosphotransferase [Xianfuyuplasma coldseepsis]QMS85767.1 phosphoenolpyruvate--protein phosphotransferase [Xianfuyuplasma coldseepsis]
MKYSGIGASAGIAIYPVYKLIEVDLTIEQQSITDVKNEVARLENAIKTTSKELQTIREQTAISMDEEHAMIFDAHIQIAQDPEIMRQVQEKIEEEHVNAEYAYDHVCQMFIAMFEGMDNEYFQERALDVKDVRRRVIAHLLDVPLNDPSLINEKVIVVAHDLTPSDTAQLNKTYVKGFITNIGGRTSHSAIMARSLEIPAIVGTKHITDEVNDGDLVILDGLTGTVIIRPTDVEIEEYRAKQEHYEKQVAIWSKFVNKPSVSKDGKHVEIAANIGSPDDLDAVKKYGAEGVGLYRTEFLYMNNDNFPTEMEQYKAYKAVLEALPNKKVIIRTLDIGGDKHLDYLPMDAELNPFLGHRALRLCLERTDIFKTQLRALLRASIHGDLHIMFPMVATLNEVRQAKAVLETCKAELHAEGIACKDDVKVGIMVEIPAVAILADQFAKEVDFFSIGTNDLIQYSFAADRMNQKVSYLYQPYNPSLLRLIKMVIDASHEAGIWTGMCGEMAGDKLAAPILLGLGLDEFSMSATSILQTRYIFSELTYSEMKAMAETCLTLDSHESVQEFVEKTIKGESK